MPTFSSTRPSARNVAHVVQRARVTAGGGGAATSTLRARARGQATHHVGRADAPPAVRRDGDPCWTDQWTHADVWGLRHALATGARRQVSAPAPTTRASSILGSRLRTSPFKRARDGPLPSPLRAGVSSCGRHTHGRLVTSAPPDPALADSEVVAPTERVRRHLARRWRAAEVDGCPLTEDGAPGGGGPGFRVA